MEILNNAASEYFGALAATATVGLLGIGLKAAKRRKSNVPASTESELQSTKIGVIFKPRRTTKMLVATWFCCWVGLSAIWLVFYAISTEFRQLPLSRPLAGWEVTLTFGWFFGLVFSLLTFYLYLHLEDPRKFRVQMSRKRYSWAIASTTFLVWMLLFTMELTPWRMTGQEGWGFVPALPPAQLPTRR